MFQTQLIISGLWTNEVSLWAGPTRCSARHPSDLCSHKQWLHRHTNWKSLIIFNECWQFAISVIVGKAMWALTQ